MPAQILIPFYFFVSCIIFPFALFNFLLLNTPIFSQLKPYVITTGSMEPVIPTGSLIYSIKDKSYEAGDLITFQNAKGTIAHRIERIVTLGHDEYFSTKGDANISPDIDLIHASQIAGKITTVIPHVGNSVIFFRTPLGYLLGIFLPAFLLIYLHLPHLAKLKS